MPTFYTNWLLDQKFHGEDTFCGYPKTLVRSLLMKEKLTYISSVSLTAVPVCRKIANGNTAKARAARTM